MVTRTDFIWNSILIYLQCLECILCITFLVVALGMTIYIYIYAPLTTVCWWWLSEVNLASIFIPVSSSNYNCFKYFLCIHLEYWPLLLYVLQPLSIIQKIPRRRKLLYLCIIFTFSIVLFPCFKISSICHFLFIEGNFFSHSFRQVC